MWRHPNEQIHHRYGYVLDIIWSTIRRHCILIHASEIKMKYTCEIKTSLSIWRDYDLGIIFFLLSSLKADDIVAGPPDTFQRIESSNSFSSSLKMLYHKHGTSPTMCGMMTACYGHTCYITVIFKAIHQSPLIFLHKEPITQSFLWDIQHLKVVVCI